MIPADLQYEIIEAFNTGKSSLTHGKIITVEAGVQKKETPTQTNSRVLDLNEFLWLRRSLAQRSEAEGSLESQAMAARTPARSAAADPSGFGALGLG